MKAWHALLLAFEMPAKAIVWAKAHSIACSVLLETQVILALSLPLILSSCAWFFQRAW